QSRALVAQLADDLRVAATRSGLAEVAPDRIIAAQAARAPGGQGLRFGAVVDGDVVVGSPLDRVRDGVAANIELVVGTTVQEVVGVARLLYPDADAARALRVIERLGFAPERARTYLDRYGAERPWRAIGHAMTDDTFRMPTLRMAEARASSGAPDTWAYEFRWRPPTGFGSVHCLDLPFAFDVLGAEKVAVVAGDSPPGSLRDDIHGAWVRFVKSGDPGWPRYDLDRRPGRVFDEPS